VCPWMVGDDGARGFPSLRIWYFSLVCISRLKRMSLAYYDDVVFATNIHVKRMVRRTEGQNRDALKEGSTDRRMYGRGRLLSEA
jgi:hypothetical protein